MPERFRGERASYNGRYTNVCTFIFTIVLYRLLKVIARGGTIFTMRRTYDLDPFHAKMPF